MPHAQCRGHKARQLIQVLVLTAGGLDSQSLLVPEIGLMQPGYWRKTDHDGEAHQRRLHLSARVDFLSLRIYILDYNGERNRIGTLNREDSGTGGANGDVGRL